MASASHDPIAAAASVLETLAHVELLHARAQVEKQCADGVVSYFVSSDGV